MLSVFKEIRTIPYLFELNFYCPQNQEATYCSWLIDVLGSPLLLVAAILTVLVVKDRILDTT